MHLHGQNVGVSLAARFHRLLVQHARERGNLVAQHGGLLELQRLRMRRHARLQRLQQRLRFAAQKLPGARHVRRVILMADQAHARRSAALDLIKQARPRAIGKNRVLTRAQAKHLLQQLDGFFHRPGIRIRAEIAVFAIHRATVISQPRVRQRAGGRRRRRVFFMPRARQLEIGVAFIVAEKNVVFGRELLDQVVFQNQRLGLGAHHRRLQPCNLADHVANARAAVVLLKIAGHALFQIARLAHIKHLALFVKVAVHPRQRRQRGHLGQQLRRVGGSGGR